jgi:hypothetical protein
MDTSILVRKKKNRKKDVYKVVIKKVSMRTCSGNLSILKSSQSCVAGKEKMTDNEIPFIDILAQLNICSVKPLQMATMLGRTMSRCQ